MVTVVERVHPILLLGTKIDRTKRQVTTHEAETYAKQEGLLYAEINALTGDNLDTVIPDFVNKIMSLDRNDCKGIKPKVEPLNVDNSNVDLDRDNGVKSPSDKTCCRIS